jgi:hypothetical protein
MHPAPLQPAAQTAHRLNGFSISASDFPESPLMRQKVGPLATAAFERLSNTVLVIVSRLLPTQSMRPAMFRPCQT